MARVVAVAEKLDHKKVYARGYYDGLQAAGVADVSKYDLKGDTMKQSKLDSIMANATSISKKVYDAVPENEHWNTTQIYNEIARHMAHPDKRLIEGCLNSLKAQGVIKEPRPGKFVRTSVHKPSAKERHLKPVENQARAPDSSPLDALVSALEQMDRVSRDLRELFVDLESAVAGVENHLEAKDGEYDKLRQLRSLLKDLD